MMTNPSAPQLEGCFGRPVSAWLSMNPAISFSRNFRTANMAASYSTLVYLA